MPVFPGMCQEDDAERTIQSFVAVLFGSVISVLSVINNSLIFYCLFNSQRRFQCYFQFLLLLSLFDIIISLCYIPVILIDSLKDWLSSVILAQIWKSYFIYLLTITHICMTASSFILVGALYERYLITIRSYYLKTFQSKRTAICVASFFIAVISKGGIVFELDIFLSEDPDCKHTVREFYVGVTELTYTLGYGTIYKFWFRNFVTVFIPFVLLTLINVNTLVVIKQQQNLSPEKELKRCPFHLETKAKVRTATLTLILVCGVYLITNVPNVVVTAWEFVDMESLTDRFYDFYMFSTDLISLLVVTACCLRLPIYMLSNPEIRRLIYRTFVPSMEFRIDVIPILTTKAFV